MSNFPSLSLYVQNIINVKSFFEIGLDFEEAKKLGCTSDIENFPKTLDEFLEELNRLFKYNPNIASSVLKKHKKFSELRKDLGL